MHTTPTAIANCLAKSFASISNYNNHRPYFKQHRPAWEQNVLSFTPTGYEQYDTDFSYAELDNALRSTSNTAPGPDNIQYEMIKRLPTHMLHYILQFYNRLWNTSTYPEKWGEAIVLAFMKPNKEPTSPLSYRPIALTSCLEKTLEK